MSKIPSDGIILRVQEQLLPLRIPPDLLLQLRHRPRDIDAHARRPAHKDARPPAKVGAELAQHIRNVWPAVLGAPAVLLLSYRRRQEGEAHKVLLEVGRRGREAKVEAMCVIIADGCGGWGDGGLAALDRGGYVERQVAGSVSAIANGMIFGCGCGYRCGV